MVWAPPLDAEGSSARSGASGSLRPVARELKAGERLMVDVNQGWDLLTACRVAPRLAEFGPGWIEEPLRRA